MLKVIILSASKYSLYTTIVTEELSRNNITPVAIIVKDIFSIKRFISEFRRNPCALIKKISRKLLFRKLRNKNKLSLAAYFNEKKFLCNSVDDLEEIYKIPVKKCNDFHSEEIIKYIDSFSSDLIVFTGGGIIKKNLLSLPKVGILNCHMGILPYYRGMDCHLWALINSDFDNIGLSTHLMDEGIDTGNLLKIMRIKVEQAEKFNDVEDLIEYFMPQFIVETIIDIQNNSYIELKQDQSDGKQYFSIKNVKLLSQAKDNFEIYKKTKKP